MPASHQIFQKVKSLTKACENVVYLTNRNPRNLERMTIAYKPSGYHLEKPGRSFWHKLELNQSGRYITAQVIHFNSGTVLQASTSEWAIKKQLFKPNDTSAYINLARVLAQRCLQSGLTEMSCTIEAAPNSKTDKFLKTLESNGIALKESDRFMPHRPWDQHRPSKPWATDE